MIGKNVMPQNLGVMEQQIKRLEVLKFLMSIPLDRYSRQKVTLSCIELERGKKCWSSESAWMVWHCRGHNG